MLTPKLTELASRVAERLNERGESLAVAESAAGGLISAALVAVPGASAFYRGGAVIYTLAGATELLSGGPTLPAGVRGATESFACWLALSAATKLGADWGIGETGAAGPSGNPYGDPAGHAWVALRGPQGETASYNIRTGLDDRTENMKLFAGGAFQLLLTALT